jgi:hypothetical protein
LRNGVASWLIFYAGQVGTVTDANFFGDRVIVFSLDDFTEIGEADVREFIKSL